MQTITTNSVIVFGLYETGLGVIHSLAGKGLKIIGIDHKKDIASYSRYVTSLKCPHPIIYEPEFIDWIISTFSGVGNKLPLFLTSDDFLISISKNRELFSKYFIFNLADSKLLEKIFDKYQQYLIAINTGIDVPKTFKVTEIAELEEIPHDISYPLFIKGENVNSWRKRISGNIKGFLVKDKEELHYRSSEIISKKVPIIVQEVIPGQDTNHFKYCSYISRSEKVLAEFTLQKIRQNPVHFGVGAVVVSTYNKELIDIGRKLFKSIGFKGVGSVEFKLDERDGRLKLIEINPRYWQQNYLSTYCGINFPYINFLDVIGSEQISLGSYSVGIKWINRQLDFDSFIKYRREGILNFRKWRKSLKGEKVYSNFLWTDPIPAFYNIEFGWKLIKAPLFFLRQIRRKNEYS